MKNTPPFHKEDVPKKVKLKIQPSIDDGLEYKISLLFAPSNGWDVTDLFTY